MAEGFDDVDPAALRRLVERQAIMDCVIKSCRGIDRGDWDLFRSAYHDDAVEDHGMYIGDLDGLIDVLKQAMSNFTSFQRYLTNSDVHIDGDEAHVESYYIIRLSLPGTSTFMVNGGRYLDRLERRSGRWGIATRVVTVEWSTSLEGPDTAGAADAPPSFTPALMSKDDVSYQRPLRITRSKQAS